MLRPCSTPASSCGLCQASFLIDQCDNIRRWTWDITNTGWWELKQSCKTFFEPLPPIPAPSHKKYPHYPKSQQTHVVHSLILIGHNFHSVKEHTCRTYCSNICWHFCMCATKICWFDLYQKIEQHERASYTISGNLICTLLYKTTNRWSGCTLTMGRLKFSGENKMKIKRIGKSVEFYGDRSMCRTL